MTEQGESVLLIGTDIPALDAKLLRRAASLLSEADATLFSTADGGYALLGLNRFHISLFRGIAWSTEHVAFATLCRIGEFGWSVCNGPMLRDIDEPGDLKWLPDEWNLFTQENEDIGVDHCDESKPCPAV